MNVLLMLILVAIVGGFVICAIGIHLILEELADITAILSKRTNRLNITFGQDERIPQKQTTKAKT